MRYSQLVKKYFDDSYPPHVKGFYLGVVIQVIMLCLLAVQAVIFRYGIMPVFWIVMGMIVIISIACFAQSTGHYTICALVVLLIVNVLMLPVIYVVSGKLMDSAVIYFIPAVLLCVVMLKDPFMHFACAGSILFFSLTIYYQCSTVRDMSYGNLDTMALYARIGFATVACGILSGACILLSIRFYAVEKSKADKAKQAAVEADNAKNVFFSNVSHEMRTPMNAILGTSHVLMNSDVSVGSMAALENIANACHALLITMEDILDFSFQAEDRLSIENSEYNIYDMLDDVINMTTVNVVGRGFDFLADVDPLIPSALLGDVKHLRQMLTYLLTDAARRTADGRVILRVLMTENKGTVADLRFEVEDSGEPISEEEKNRIFDSDQVGTQSGQTRERTYIALSFCKKIVEIMKGRLFIESNATKGNRIYFCLSQKLSEVTDSVKAEPLGKVRALVYEKNRECSDMLVHALGQCKAEAEFVSSAEEFRKKYDEEKYSHVFIAAGNYEYVRRLLRDHRGRINVIIMTDLDDDGEYGIMGKLMLRPAFYTNVKAALFGGEHFSLRNVSMKSSFTCPGVRVMAVDDNLTNLHVVSSLLSKYKMEVLTASGGRECLNRLEHQQADIIFLDYMMPEMDGVDTLKNIRAMDRDWAKKVPVIALTANAVSGVRQMLLDEGFSDYITKPISVDKLEKCLIRHLDQADIVPSDLSGGLWDDDLV